MTVAQLVEKKKKEGGNGPLKNITMIFLLELPRVQSPAKGFLLKEEGFNRTMDRMRRESFTIHFSLAFTSAIINYDVSIVLGR